MRELKFRIWDKQNKTWLENSSSLHCFSNWSICPFTGKLIDYVGAIDGDHGDKYTASPAPDYYVQGGKIVKDSRFVIQQYTGLKDRNGVEMYEGDIVEYNPDEPIFRIGIIEYSDYYNGWSIKDRNCYPSSEYGQYSLASPFLSFNTVKIIGNIFETPELLK